jgi:hypothetical protein
MAHTYPGYRIYLALISVSASFRLFDSLVCDKNPTLAIIVFVPPFLPCKARVDTFACFSTRSPSSFVCQTSSLSAPELQSFISHTFLITQPSPRGWILPCCYNIIADYDPYIPWTGFTWHFSQFLPHGDKPSNPALNQAHSQGPYPA